MKLKKIAAIVVAIALVTSVCGAFPISAVENLPGTQENPIPIECGDEPLFLNSGWYVVGDVVEREDVIHINENAEVNLIISGGGQLGIFADGTGIQIRENATLNVFGEGGLWVQCMYGIRILDGGVLNMANQQFGASVSHVGIQNTNGGTVILSVDEVFILSQSTGISNDGTFIFDSGYFIVDAGSDAIFNGTSGILNINGDTVVLRGEYNGIVNISGDVNIDGGDVTITGGNFAVYGTVNITSGATIVWSRVDGAEFESGDINWSEAKFVNISFTPHTGLANMTGYAFAAIMLFAGAIGLFVVYAKRTRRENNI